MTKPAETGSGPDLHELSMKAGHHYLDGTPVSLTGTESQIFELLLANLGQDVSHERILEHLKEIGATRTVTTELNTVRVHLSHIRTALNNAREGCGELIATRRSGTCAILTEKVKLGATEHDERIYFGCGPDNRTITFRNDSFYVDDDPVRISPFGRKILLYLLENRGSTCSTIDILRHLYHDRPLSDWPNENLALKVQVLRIRDALGDEDKKIVQTAWGRGYAIQAESSGLAPESLPADLPSWDCRWVSSRKKQVAELIRMGTYTVEQIVGFYPALTAKQVESWVSLLQRHGWRGLRETRSAQYAFA